VPPRRDVGHFRSEQAHRHFVAVYRAAMTELPPAAETVDLPTSFGTVRAYRFAGPSEAPPVVLLPGRNACTPMWRANIAALRLHRVVIALDLLGEAGMSVQDRPIAGPADEAQWLDEALAELRLPRAHLTGVSIGGWTAVNCAVHRPGRVASLLLLDPAITFARIPVTAVFAALGLFVPGVPEALRRRVLRWISGGADVDGSVPEAALISAGSSDYVLRKSMPRMFSDDQLRNLEAPVLALIAGRSVIHDADRAAARARRLLRRGDVELWPDASHAINGEYPAEIAERAGRFWAAVDGLS
jgi:pimeloyl-ACP methyl ester carboxylesterase